MSRGPVAAWPENQCVPHLSRRKCVLSARVLKVAATAPLMLPVLAAIDDTVFQILEEIGLSQAPESGIAYMTSVGRHCR